MADRCCWCTDTDGNTAVNFAVVYGKDIVPPVFIKYCPFCGKELE